jgi:peptidoglycan-associated lipoprotein
MKKGLNQLIISILALSFLIVLGCCTKKSVRPEAGVEEVTPPKEEALPSREEAKMPAEGEKKPLKEAPISEEEIKEKEKERLLKKLTLNDAYFDFDKYNIREDTRKVLEENAKILLAYPNVKIQIEGHCDERGTNEYNLALGERRATSAKNFLVNSGVKSDRISTISYGEERPQCTEHNEECWQKNRRAHIIIISK